jgi:hypothetical protein
MSPEEYAARKGHLWGCFGLSRNKFENASLAAWIRRLQEILSDSAELERCQQRYLTPEELAEVRKQEAEGF